MDHREEPGKQKTRSCRAQEFARSRAQENERRKNEGPTGLKRQRQEQETVSAALRWAARL